MTIKTLHAGDAYDAAIGKGASRAVASDAAFGNDFASRRRSLMAQAHVLRVLVKFGRLSVGRILSHTHRTAVPVAEALAALAEMGLITMRRYPETGCTVPLVDLMPSVETLNKIRVIVAETSSGRSRDADIRVYAKIQERIDVLEGANNEQEPTTPH